MSARSYLSIGDVLTLLRQEFPDITISKIRFLESQGLVNPERTPSGYRKFYEHDVERLRWVLRQQREHFLPLKVIKDRLEEDAGVAGSAEPSTTAEDAASTVGVAAGPTAASVGEAVGEAAHAATAPATVPAEPVLVGQGASSSHRSAEAGSAPADPSSALPGIESPATRPGASAGTTAPPVARAHRANLAAPPHRAAESAGNGAGHGSGSGAGPAASAAGDPQARRASRSVTPPSPPDAAPAPDRAPESGTGSTGGPAPAGTTGAGGSSEPVGAAGPVGPMGSMGGASLSLDELCAASGLGADHVGQLQEYGLVRAAVVGGVEYFDEEALTVASVAAKLAAFGIEARHLRLYKNAVDREAGFIEQIVLPMVRQRNPEARARAGRTAEDLAALGQQLKGSLLRTALRDLLNG